MGGSGADAPVKASKPSAPQEQQPPGTSSAATPAVYPDWTNFQGYPPIPPHGFFPSPVVSSPQGHPYMWGAQPMMPPYGTPPYVMYPPGGIYAHPSMPPGAHPFNPYAMTSPNGNADTSGTAAAAPAATASVAAAGETDGKSSEGKEKSPIKRSKDSLGSLNMITGKNSTEHGKTSGASANGATSQSGETGSESSSGGSEANSENDSQHKESGHEQDGEYRGSQNGVSRSPSQAKLKQTMAIMPMASSGPGPTTNLNIGMDYWANTASSSPAMHGKTTPTAVPGAVVPTEWMQDERELKRQRRKQSNRDSARRSRLRKQAECEELAQRAEVLKQENASLRDEVNRIRKEYDELILKNDSLKLHQGGSSGGIDGNFSNGSSYAEHRNYCPIGKLYEITEHERSWDGVAQQEVQHLVLEDWCSGQ